MDFKSSTAADDYSDPATKNTRLNGDRENYGIEFEKIRGDGRDAPAAIEGAQSRLIPPACSSSQSSDVSLKSVNGVPRNSLLPIVGVGAGPFRSPAPQRRQEGEGPYTKPLALRDSKKFHTWSDDLSPSAELALTVIQNIMMFTLPSAVAEEAKPSGTAGRPVKSISDRSEPSSLTMIVLQANLLHRRPTAFDRLPLQEKQELRAEAWLASDLLDPNIMITLKYGRAEVFAARAKGLTLADLVYQDREAIRTALRASGTSGFPHMSVLETHHGFHAHILANLPVRPKVRRRLATLLCHRRRQFVPDGRTALQVVSRGDTGTTVHFLKIDPAKAYVRTGRRGLLGLIDYTGKHFNRTLNRRDIKLLGKIAGCSEDISRETQKMFLRPHTAVAEAGPSNPPA